MPAFQRRRFTGRTFNRGPRRRWQWIRSNENNVTVVTAGGFEQFDLLSNYRTLAGISLNLPEFTIWRIRLRVSVRVNVSPATTFTSADGVKIACFVDDFAAPNFNPTVSAYDEHYMVWDSLYAFEAIQKGANGGSLANAFIPLFADYDIKTHRKLGTIKESLILQVGTIGAANINDFAFTQNTLVLASH